MNLHPILCQAWTFFCRNYSDDSEGHRYGQLMIGSLIATMCPFMHPVLCRVFWWNIKSPRWLSFPTAQIWHPVTSGFPKIKMTFERAEISDHWWDSGKYNGAADGDWENCVRSQGTYFEGTEASLSYVQCFLYLVSSSINVFIFHITWLDTFWTDLVYQYFEGTQWQIWFIISLYDIQSCVSQ